MSCLEPHKCGQGIVAKVGPHVDVLQQLQNRHSLGGLRLRWGHKNGRQKESGDGVVEQGWRQGVAYLCDVQAAAHGVTWRDDDFEGTRGGGLGRQGGRLPRLRQEQREALLAGGGLEKQSQRRHM